MSMRRLVSARRDRCDEYYTLPDTVERAIPYHARAFQGAHVVACCDDGPDSAFTRFWLRHAADYAIAAFTAFTFDASWGTLFETGCGMRFDLTLDGRRGAYTPADLKRTPLDSSGGYDSRHVLGLLADPRVVVTTNPPFSRLRSLLAILDRLDTRFLILAPLTAVTYRPARVRMLDGRWRLGGGLHRGSVPFLLPAGAKPTGVESGLTPEGRAWAALGGIRWLTSLPYDDPRPTWEPSGRFTPDRFPRYDQTDAVDCPILKDLPAQAPCPVGVPLTVFDHIQRMPHATPLGIRDDLTVDGRACFTRVLIRVGDAYAAS